MERRWEACCRGGLYSKELIEVGVGWVFNKKSIA